MNQLTLAQTVLATADRSNGSSKSDKFDGHTAEQCESIIAFTLEHAADLSLDWENISNNVKTGNPDRFRAAENLVYYGLAERDFRPARVETRRDWSTGKKTQVGIGCRCFFRMKPAEVSHV